MVAVYGIEMNEGMASLGKLLLQLHFGVILFSLFGGIFNIVQHVSIVNALDDSGYNNNESGNAYYFFIVACFATMGCPLGVLFILYIFIKGTNQGGLQGLCFLDGCCTCCAVFGIGSIVMSIIAYQDEKKKWEDLSESCQWGNCEAYDNVVDAYSVATIFAVIYTILLVADTLFCGFLTFKMNVAVTELKKGNSFVGASAGAPPPVVVGQVVGQPIP
jgi:hypothetical protein